MGTDPRSKARWGKKDLGVKILGEATSETLLYVGCAPSYDPRVQNVSTALVKIFQRADLDFSILGKNDDPINLLWRGRQGTD